MTRLRMPRGRMAEIAALIGVYILFLIVGVYSGQTTMNVDIISPIDGVDLRSSPVELVATVTARGVPLPNVTATFTVIYWKEGRTDTDVSTGGDGIARLLFPAFSGNYTWHVTATKEGYPKIMSRFTRFSVALSLAVEAMAPSTHVLAVSPVDFKARVTDTSGRPVQSANVTFYVDSIMIGYNLTGRNGVAWLSRVLDMGRHAWFASASKGGEGGISDTTLFQAGQLASVMSSDSEVFRFFDLGAPRILAVGFSQGRRPNSE